MEGIKYSGKNMEPKDRPYEAVVIGTSSGGLNALMQVLPPLPANFQIPIIIVQHLGPSRLAGGWTQNLNNLCQITVKEADEKEKLTKSTAYTAPPNYHLLVEYDHTLTLSIDQKVNFARPSIDVLFESASAVFSAGLIGILLTGANSDGARGMSLIKKNGGLTVVQDPDTAESRAMPESAIEMTGPDYILPLDGIVGLLQHIHSNKLKKA